MRALFSAAVVASLIAACGESQNSGTPAQKSIVEPQASWSQEVQRAISAAEYRFSERDGHYDAFNRAHGLLARFGADGLVVRTGADDPNRAQLQIRPAKLGIGESFGPVAPRLGICADPGLTDEKGQCLRRLEYEGAEISEWWVNTDAGLEQGFTVFTPPPPGQPLVLRLEISGLTTEVTGGGSEVVLASARGPELRYGSLAAVDATGMELPARLEAVPGGIQIVVDTETAEWPVTVDPLLTSYSWVAGTPLGQLGWSVAAAGDVNGDGFGDLIVGLPVYYNGQNNEGGAFLYLGSPAGLQTVAAWTAEGDQDYAFFGQSVASAGDVNADGYSDVLVGANGFDNDEANEGRAFLFLGTSLGLSATPAWTAESNQEGAWFGSAVSSAGDVNGDGYSDVVIGAVYYDGGEYDEGRAFLYLGGASGLESASAWTAECNQSSASFGYSVASAGDVNGDGFSDVIVGARGARNGEAFEGRAFVYLGSSEGLGGEPAWVAESDQASAYFGCSVASAGDVNADGYADVVIGAENYDNGEINEGRAFLYLGSATGLQSTPAWTAESNQAAAFFGHAVASAGDVNGDGFADVLVGAYLYDGDNADEGRVSLYLGSETGLQSEANWNAEGELASAYFGNSVASAGDVNGDGLADLVIGAPQYNADNLVGRAFVYHGATSLVAGTESWSVQSDYYSGWPNFGFSVASAGDVNGDGFDDLIVGSVGYAAGEDSEGRALLYLGSASGLQSTPAWTAEGDQAWAYFGYSVASAGDVNADGYADVTVGAVLYDSIMGGMDAGKVFVYLGSSAGLSPAPSWTAEGDQFMAYFGNSVAAAGDVNGDGYGDLLVGAPYTHNFEGRAFVYYGSALGLKPEPAWVAASGQGAQHFGWSVASVGDANADGYGDIVVGGINWAAIYLGSASGPQSPAIALNDCGAFFGNAVASAGDVNGDARDDLIASSPYCSNGEAAEGEAFVHLGGSSGLVITPVWSAEGSQASAAFGQSVASAGDVNGDGRADILVSAPQYDGAYSNEGRVYLYLGTASGVAAEAAWSKTSGQSLWANFGNQVASAGDVNGDGYDDIAIGSPSYNNIGRVLVHHGNGGDGDTTAGLPMRPRAFQVGSATPIVPWGVSNSETSFDVRVFGRPIAGRGHVKLQVEAKPGGVPFDGTGLVTQDTWSDSGTAGTELRETLTQLSEDTAYHWRARVLYHPVDGQPQLWSRWVYGGVPGQTSGVHVRTARDTDGDGIADPLDDDDDGDGLTDTVDCAPLDPANQVDPAAVCAVAEATCGVVPDGCGGTVICGTCTGYQTCGGGGIPNECGCTPTACETGQCGSLADGCGGSLDCGGCTAPETCGGGDVPNQCGCAPRQCGAGECGTLDDGCGGTIDCGGCAAPQTCGGGGTPNQCGCTRTSCATGQCGSVSDSCGGTLDCGSCSGLDTCGGGGTPNVCGCTPISCAAAGANCGMGSSNGCGAVLDCTCSGFDSCGDGAPFVCGANAETLEIDQANAQFGAVVASAGDVNGDGYGDLIVGAPHFRSGETEVGAVLLYLGSASGFQGAASNTLLGIQPSAHFGGAVASAGDVNGDGHADVIVGAPDFDGIDSRTDAGRVYVYLGSESGLQSPAAWTLDGEEAFDRFGYAVAAIGDVEGDGLSDLAVGAPNHDTVQTDSGAVSMYLSSASGLQTHDPVVLEGDQAGGLFGEAVAGAGDVNGDGFADLVVGEPGAYSGEGRAQVYFGSATGLVAPAVWQPRGAQAGAAYGQAVASAGDVNGDGRSEIVVGAPGFDGQHNDGGRAYVYEWSESGFAAILTKDGDQDAAALGWSVGSPGDENGDGFSDVVVGAPGWDGGESDTGQVALFLGSASGVRDTAVWSTSGDQSGAAFGSAVAGAGDINGDGLGDLVVSAPQYNGGDPAEGRAFVYLGREAGLASSSSWTEMLGEGYATVTTAAGDINGDGFEDFAVGEANTYFGGQVRIYRGSATGPEPWWTATILEPGVAQAYFGISVSSAGDVNGDGYADLIVGSLLGADEWRGAASVYYGSAEGLETTPAWTVEGELANSYFGASVASAGDVNGDGFGDVVVGAFGYSNGQEYEGKAYLYLGSADGLASEAVWSAESDLQGNYFGQLVAAAGDVNGDGRGDVLIGSSSSRTVSLFLGSAAGLVPTSWTRQEGGSAGYTVAGAGDVNGDGFGDIIVGDGLPQNYWSGRASVFLGGAAGLSTAAAWQIDGTQTSTVLNSVAGGDYNGDGYSDVAVGWSTWTNGYMSQGRTTIHYGSPAGIQTSGSEFREGASAHVRFGSDLAGGDFNGDGYCDLAIGNGAAGFGHTFLYLGNGADGTAPALPSRAQARRPGSTTPIAAYGKSSSATSFDVAAYGRPIGGRGRVKLQVEVKPFNTPFDGTNLRAVGDWTDSGLAGVNLQQTIASVPPATAYHWRARILYDPSKSVGQLWSRWQWGGISGQPSAGHVRLACVATTCLAQNAECGTIPDGCGGSLSCGECPSPETCGGGGAPNQCGGCVPTDCAVAGAECGLIADGCGEQLDCGECAGYEICGALGPNLCDCVPTTCAAQNAQCGSISDGCGGTLGCGTCSGSDSCGGGGTPNQCGCTPTTCAALGANCGEVANGCGGTLSCGTCSGSDTCGGGGTPNQCGCAPTTCAALGANCGEVANGCGGTLSCGACSGSDTCGGGGTPNQCGCTPTTCAALVANCGNPADGCGGNLSCGTCSGSDTCGGGGTPNQCGCTPTTCSALGASCGGAADGCGGTLSCGECVAPQTCGGGGTPNQCGCTQRACGAGECGAVANGCGGTMQCPQCTPPQTCGGGGTPNQCGCTPKTCEQLAAECGSLPDECGGTLACGECIAPEACGGDHQCHCIPTTCAAADVECGTIADGCFATLDCGGCAAAMACGAAGVANHCGHVPIADAGDDATVDRGTTVTLHGGDSLDGDGEALTYSWSIVTRPAGSTAALSDATAESPSFVADRTGTFVIELVVDDGNGPSLPDTVTVTVVLPTVSVPNLQGLARAAAESAITSLGLTVGAVTAGYSTTLAVGVVLGQQPPPGTVVPVETSVSLVVVQNRAPVLASVPAQNLDPTSCLRLQLVASDPDNDPITYELDELTAPPGMQLDAATGVLTWFPTAADAEPHSVVVRARDNENGVAQQTLDLTVAPFVDRMVPRVELLAPARVAPNTVLTVGARVRDDGAIAAVRFYVDGLLLSEQASAPFAITYNVSETEPLAFEVTATDTAGRTGRSSIEVVVDASSDTVAPVIARLLAPASAAPATTVWVACEATDAFGVVRVEYTLGDVTVVSDEPPFVAEVLIPSTAVPGETLVLSTQAFDAAGNVGLETAEVDVVTDADISAPSAVTLSAPAFLTAGSLATLTASALDDAGIAKVEFLLNDMVDATAYASPYSDELSVASELLGAGVRVRARAYDYAGNVSDSVPQCAAVVSPPAGAVIGYVFDDSTGRPLAGAEVTVIRAGGSELSPSLSLFSGAEGRFSTTLAQGEGRVVIAVAGYSACERAFTLRNQQVVRIRDCRLTPLAVATLVTSAAGATLASSDAAVTLTFPIGALSESTSASLTPLSEQSLPALLPLGWSPMALFYIAPPDTATNQPLELSITAADAGAIGAQWDAQSRVWIRRALVDAGSGRMTMTLPHTGAVGLVVPDASEPFVVVEPVVGAALVGIPESQATLPASAVAAVLPTPQMIVLSEGAGSEVVARLNAGTVVPSGLPIRLEIAESYALASGGTLAPEPSVQEVSVYARELGREGRVFISPSHDMLTSAAVRSGVINVSAYPSPVGGVEQGAGVIGQVGGTVVAGSGVWLDVPPNALAAATGVSVTPAVPDSSLSGLAGFDLLSTVDISFTGASLATSAQLRLQLANVSPSDQLLLVRGVAVDNELRHELVGVGTLVGDIVQVAGGGLGLPLPGIRTGGRYTLLRPDAPIGFVTGQVMAVRTGTPTPSASSVVSVNSLPFVSLTASTADAFYVVAAPLGTAVVSAHELSLGDAARAEALLDEAGETLVLTLTLSESRPSVVTVTPGNGATKVATTATVVIDFSEKIDGASLTSGTVSLTPNGGNAVAAALKLTASGTSVVLVPTAPLTQNTTYELHVTEGVESVYGAPLTGAFVSSFTTIDQTPPHSNPGEIAAAVPSNGTTQVTGGAGATEPGTTVIATNTTTGRTTTVIAGADGSFAVTIDASPADIITLQFMDAAGNITSLGALTLRNADGTTVVGPAGGVVEASDGSGARLVVPADAVPAGTIISLTGLAPAAFTAGGLGSLGFISGVHLDMGATVAAKPLTLSTVAPDGLGLIEGDGALLWRQQASAGGPLFELVDTAHIRPGRVETGSPPNQCVLWGGDFVFTDLGPNSLIGLALISSSITAAGGEYVRIKSGDMETFGRLDLAFSTTFVVTRGLPWVAEFYNAAGESVWKVDMDAPNWVGIQPVYFPGPPFAAEFRVLSSVPATNAEYVAIDTPIRVELSDALFEGEELAMCADLEQEGHCICLHELESGFCIEGEVSVVTVPTGLGAVPVKRMVEISPAHRLRFGRVYELDITGIRDATGTRDIMFAGSNPHFTTFAPTVIASVDTGALFAEAADGAPRDIVVRADGTLAVALGNGIDFMAKENQDPDSRYGFIDVSDPRAPVYATAQVIDNGTREARYLGLTGNIALSPSGQELLTATGSIYQGSWIRTFKNIVIAHEPQMAASMDWGASETLTAALWQLRADVATPRACTDENGWPTTCVDEPSVHSEYPENPMELGIASSLAVAPDLEAPEGVDLFVASTGYGIQWVSLDDVYGRDPYPLQPAPVFEWSGVYRVATIDSHVIGLEGARTPAIYVIASDGAETKLLEKHIERNSDGTSRGEPLVMLQSVDLPARVITTRTSYPEERGATATIDLVAFATMEGGGEGTASFLLAELRNAEPQNPALKNPELRRIAKVRLPTSEVPTDIAIDASARIAYVSTEKHVYAVDIDKPRSGLEPLHDGDDALDARILAVEIKEVVGAGVLAVSADSRFAYIGDRPNRKIQLVSLTRESYVGTVVVAVNGQTASEGVSVGSTSGAMGFTAATASANCSGLVYAWTFGDGTTSNEASPRHQYAEAGAYTASVTVSCADSPAATSTSEITVLVVKLRYSLDGQGSALVASTGHAMRPIPGTYTLAVPPGFSIESANIEFRHSADASILIPVTDVHPGVDIAVAIAAQTWIGPPGLMETVWMVLNKGTATEVHSTPVFLNAEHAPCSSDLCEAGECPLVASSTVRPKLILPVRNFESAANGAEPGAPPPAPTELPFAVPAPCDICVPKPGRVTVSVGGSVIASGDVAIALDGTLSVTEIPGVDPPVVSDRGSLMVMLDPAAPGAKATVTLEPADESETRTQDVDIKTDIKDAGAAPVGHTFVKDVSLVDGHLFKQFEDLRFASPRGVPLAFTRSYTSRGLGEGPLGPGWSYSLLSYVVADGVQPHRWMVVGGEGTGQVFTCATTTSCTPQRGFNGSFSILAEGGPVRFIWRSLSGVQYHYGQENTAVSPSRYPLVAIVDPVDPVGRAAAVQHGGADHQFQVERIYEAGNSRFLQLRYAVTLGTAQLRLVAVELMRNSRAPLPLALGSEGIPLGVCVTYQYDSVYGRLTTATRHDGGCDGPALRTERYAYRDSPDPELRDNLASYTDPNGVATSFEYYPADGTFLGASDFQYFGDSAERILSVREPEPGGATTFTYSLVNSGGYSTTITGPRSGALATYVLNSYGNTVRVTRKLNGSESAVVETHWDAAKVRPDWETDPLGRQTSFAYDTLGKLIERRIDVAAVPGADPVYDASGAVVDEVVERWAYDPTFGGETCHVDVAGRVTTSVYDEGTGLLLTRYAYARPVAAATVASATSCAAVAAQAEDSDGDTLSSYTYCQGDTCGTAKRGDLLTSDEGTRALTVQQYDADGNPKSVARATDGSPIIETLTYDALGRLWTRSDTLGHYEIRYWDGLDRLTSVDRPNLRGASFNSLGECRKYTYYDGGQLKQESVGPAGCASADLTRSYTLDGMNHTRETTEAGTGVSYTTTAEYDAAGNKFRETDRRGVKTETTFDLGDRPTFVIASVGTPAAFVAQGGDEDAAGEKTVATYSYDVAGNRLNETDVHGHLTTYTYDGTYHVATVTDDEEHVTLRHNDAAGNKLYERDDNGAESTWAYDHANRVTEAVDGVGRKEARSYNGSGDLVTETRSFAGTTTFERTVHHDRIGRPRVGRERFADALGMTTLAFETTYDDAAHKVTFTDRRGKQTVQQLDDLDRVVQEIVDPAGLSLETSYEYDAQGNRTAVVDALGRRTEEHYDGLSRLVSRKLPMGVSEEFKVDGAGSVYQHTDRRGIVRKTYYDTLGRPTIESLVESQSNGGAPLRTLQREYLDATAQLRETDARGNATVRSYDCLHRETLVRYPDNETSLTTYDAVNKRSVTDRKGHWTEWEYDFANRVRVETDEVGSLSTTYDDTALTETHTYRRAESSPTVTRRDGLGRVIQVARGVAIEKTEYDGNGSVVRVTDANNHTTESGYDAANRKTSDTRGTAVTHYVPDDVGNIVQVKGPRGSWPFDVRVTFDDLNRPVRSEDALGNVTSRAFDGAGNKLCEVRPLGGAAFLHGGAAGKTVAALQSLVCGRAYVTKWTYDEESKLTAVTDAAGGLTTFVYDAARNLLAKQDANANLTTYQYDTLNRLTDEWQHLDERARVTTRTAVPTPPFAAPDVVAGTGALHWHSTYDDNGNVETATDPRGLVTTHVYDALNRLQSTALGVPAGTEPPYLTAIAYEYDGNGNAKKVTETRQTDTGAVNEVTGRVYNNLDRLESETRGGKTVGYTYDNKGNRWSVTDPDGVATSYLYDEHDRLTTVTTPGSATTSYEYYPDGLSKRVIMPNGIEERRCYDNAARLKAIATAHGTVAEDCTVTAARVSRYTYEYDRNGNRTRQAEERPSVTEETTYGYDAIDRLIGVKYPDHAELYQLDAVGNRRGERHALPSKVAALTVATFAALAPADRTHDITAVFNRADWLTSRTDAMDASRAAVFTYDLAGNMTSKVTPSVSRDFAWDGRNALMAVRDDDVEVGSYDYNDEQQRLRRDTAAEHVAYVLDDMYVLQEADGTSSRRYHYGTAPLAVVDDAGTRFLSVDALGSVGDETAADGAVAATRQYGAWGEYRNATAPTAADAKVGFTGHQFDPETGLVYARSRYYDPDLKIFLSRDSFEGDLANTPSLHRYAYAHGNPVINTDPTGQFVPLVLLGALIAWEALTIDEELTSGKDVVASSQAVQQRAMTYFENRGYSVQESSGSTAAAVATTTGGQFATSVFFGLPNMLMDGPEKTVRSWLDLPVQAARGAYGVATKSGDEQLAAVSEFAGGAGGTLAVAAGFAESAGAYRGGALRQRVLSNVAKSQQARAASGFADFAESESRLVQSAAGDAAGPAEAGLKLLPARGQTARAVGEPALVDADFLVTACERGNTAALAALRGSSAMAPTSVLEEFLLNVRTHAQRMGRLQFLKDQGVQPLPRSEAAGLRTTPEFQAVFEAVRRDGHSVADAELAAFARASGREALTAERRLSNFFNLKMPQLGVRIRKVR